MVEVLSTHILDDRRGLGSNLGLYQDVDPDRTAVRAPIRRISTRRISTARIMVHDFAGHAFPVQLSRAFARSGHDVRHLYCTGNPTPKGAINGRAGDPNGFGCLGIDPGRPYPRYDFWRRFRYEVAYGDHLADAIKAWRPDVFVCANTPLDALRRAARACRQHNVPLVFWVQDLNGLAASRILSRKLPGVGRLIGGHYVRMERAIARSADALVSISPDFSTILDRWVGPGATTVIENWAPLEDVPQRRRDNPWARAHDLVGKTTFMYTGMMGLKHNAELLLALARRYRDRDDVAVVAVTEGLGAERLRAGVAQEALTNLRVVGFQPYNVLPDVLASADVLTATLGAQAGAFAVPSKILSYFCAGRPILAAMPSANLAARRIRSSGAGVVVTPDDAAAFVAAAEQLRSQPARRDIMAVNARAYAEKTFCIDEIASRFETVLGRAIAND